MERQEEFTLIYYNFDEGELLAAVEDEDHYDHEACVQKYADLCREVLEKAYPTAEVEVLPGSAETQVLRKTSAFEQAYRDAWLVEGADVEQIPASGEAPDPDEVDSVEYLCNEVYQGQKWVVPRSWLSLQEASDSFSVPVPVIRWACREKLIDKAKQANNGEWEFPREAFADFNRDSRFVDCEILCVSLADDGVYRCRSMDMLAESPTPLLEVRFILTVPDELDIPRFRRENSSLSISIREDHVILTFEHFRSKVPWTGTQWSYDAYAQALEACANDSEFVEGKCRKSRSGEAFVESVSFEFTYDVSRHNTLYAFINEAAGVLRTIIREAEVHLLGGPRWRKSYETDEALFCEEVIAHLLRRMGFDPVRKTHGPTEFGRDFVFTEHTRFGTLRYYGLQAKAGSVRGGNNSKIDDILGQIEDAFTIPYEELGREGKIYISELIIAISGHFTDNAKKKILSRMPHGFAGSVHFWDKEKILSLISRHWSESG